MCFGRFFGSFTVSSMPSGAVGGLFSFAGMAFTSFGVGFEVSEVAGRGSGVCGSLFVQAGPFVVVFGGFLGG